MPRDLVIRPVHQHDAERISSIYRPVVTDTAVSFEEQPPGSDEVVRRMVAQPRLPWLAAEVEGRVAGYAYASQHRKRSAYRWCADSSVYVDRDYQGQGIGRLLYGRLVDEVRDLGYVSLFAGIAVPNPVSVRLHEGLGFRAIGMFPAVGFKMGKWHDVGWWHKPLADPPVPPSEPRAWDTLS